MTKKDFIDVAVCSVTANANKPANLENAWALVREAAKRGAEWVCLPEMFSFHGPYDQLLNAAETQDGPLCQSMSQLASELGVVLFAGSVPEREGANTKVYNTQYVYGPSGNLLAKYRKIHLFNLSAVDGTPLYRESDGYLAGREPVSLEIDGWRIGLATCYDLRFPELFAELSKPKPVDALIVPAAFTLQTGMYHWELLCRGRAIDHLCYVIAANQVGEHSAGKASFGHGMVVDPWGEVLTNTASRPGVALARISRSAIEQGRARLPLLQNRRPDLFGNKG